MKIHGDNFTMEVKGEEPKKSTNRWNLDILGIAMIVIWFFWVSFYTVVCIPLIHSKYSAVTVPSSIPVVAHIIPIFAIPLGLFWFMNSMIKKMKKPKIGEK